MSRIGTVCLLVALFGAVAGIARAQGAPDPEHEHQPSCTYTILTNGPTWDSDTMWIPYDVVANAWAREGAYGGGGRSTGMGLRAGGAGVAVASVGRWFKVTHLAVATCQPVKFESDAMVEATVATQIHGDSDDYALAAGFQSISGNALRPATVAVAATNSGSPVQQSTVSVSFGTVGFSVTIPGVSVTTDTIDRDRKSVLTWGSARIEEEQITMHCWTKIKVVTNGPFGGMAWASVEESLVQATTASTCSVHQESGSHTHVAREG